MKTIWLKSGHRCTLPWHLTGGLVVWNLNFSPNFSRKLLTPGCYKNAKKMIKRFPVRKKASSVLVLPDTTTRRKCLAQLNSQWRIFYFSNLSQFRNLTNIMGSHKTMVKKLREILLVFFDGSTQKYQQHLGKTGIKSFNKSKYLRFNWLTYWITWQAILHNMICFNINQVIFASYIKIYALVFKVKSFIRISNKKSACQQIKKTFCFPKAFFWMQNVIS